MLASATEVTSLAEHDQVFLALIALVGTSIAALVYVIRNGRITQTAADDAATAAAQATAANAAVNNVGPGKHTMYDMVENIRNDVLELKENQKKFDAHGWETLPADINTAVGLTTTIRDLQRHTVEVHDKLDVIIAELREHVDSHSQ